jgi:hypothetical protein
MDMSLALLPARCIPCPIHIGLVSLLSLCKFSSEFHIHCRNHRAFALLSGFCSADIHVVKALYALSAKSPQYMYWCVTPLVDYVTW